MSIPVAIPEVLDLNTLLLAESILGLAFAVIFFGLQRVFPQVRGAQAVALSSLLLVPGTVCVALGAHLPAVVSGLIADTLLLASLIALYEAVVRFTGGANYRWFLWLIAFSCFAVVYYFTEVHPNQALRTEAVALSIAALRGATALTLLRRSMRSTQRVALAAFGLCMACQAGASLYRAAALSTHAAPLDRLALDAVHSRMLAMGLLYLPVSALCFLFLVGRELTARRRLEADWAAAPGTLNRRRMEVNLSLELERFHLGQQPFSIVMMRVATPRTGLEDGGRNERRGVIRDVTQTIASQLRATDHVGRYTCDEFLLFLSNAREAEAALVAERCAVQVERLSSMLGSGALLLSAGITEAVRGDTALRLIDRAEQALRLAEAGGGRRQQVLAAADSLRLRDEAERGTTSIRDSVPAVA